MYYPQGCYKQFKGNYNNQCVEESLPWASSKLCLHTPKTKTLFSTFQLHRFCILQPSPQNMYHLLITRQSIRNTFVTFAVEHDAALSQYFPGVEEVLRSFI